MSQCCIDRSGREKAKYRSREAAELAARDSIGEGGEFTVYPCEQGDGWHWESATARNSSKVECATLPGPQEWCSLQSGNRSDELIDDQTAEYLENLGRSNSLFLIESRIRRLEQEIESGKETVQGLRREIGKLVQLLKYSELQLRMSLRELSISRYDYARARRRLIRG